MNEDNGREAFEAWISGPPFERRVKRWPQDSSVAWPGNYRDIEVDLAWCAWHDSREQAFDEVLQYLDAQHEARKHLNNYALHFGNAVRKMAGLERKEGT